MRARARSLVLRSSGAFVLFLKVLEVSLKFTLVFIPVIVISFTIAIIIAIVGIAETVTMVGHSPITNGLAHDLNEWVIKMISWTGIDDLSGDNTDQ